MKILKKRNSEELIEKVFIEFIQYKEINEISVTDICKKIKLNRSTFYANYIDIYDLAKKIKIKLEQDISNLYKDELENQYNSNNFLKLFEHIKENQLFYRTYFKLGFDNENYIFQYDINQAKLYFDNQHIDYHIEFFKNGLNAIIKKWLKEGCIETPQTINEIISSEYKTRIIN
ncbi:MAG: TetR-like C-terminal domain-containing protein [Bacilli bacterium]